jgi:hypothetical protein
MLRRWPAMTERQFVRLGPIAGSQTARQVKAGAWETPLGARGRVERVEARREGVEREFGGGGVLAAERMVHDRFCSLEAQMGGEGTT